MEQHQGCGRCCRWGIAGAAAVTVVASGVSAAALAAGIILGWLSALQLQEGLQQRVLCGRCWHGCHCQSHDGYGEEGEELRGNLQRHGKGV